MTISESKSRFHLHGIINESKVIVTLSLSKCGKEKLYFLHWFQRVVFRQAQHDNLRKWVRFDKISPKADVTLSLSKGDKEKLIRSSFF
jgi:hypothetical protein